MVSDTRVLGTRLPVPAIAEPDDPVDIAAKRREFVRCSSDATCLTPADIPLALFYFRKCFENFAESRGFPLAPDENAM
jgi:hypothetical protein